MPWLTPGLVTRGRMGTGFGHMHSTRHSVGDRSWDAALVCACCCSLGPGLLPFLTPPPRPPAGCRWGFPLPLTRTDHPSQVNTGLFWGTVSGFFHGWLKFGLFRFSLENTPGGQDLWLVLHYTPRLRLLGLGPPNSFRLTS